MTIDVEQFKTELEERYGKEIVLVDAGPADYRRLTREMWEIKQDFGGPIAWERMARRGPASDRRVVLRYLAASAIDLVSFVMLLLMATAGLDSPIGIAGFVLTWWVSASTNRLARADSKLVWRIIQAKTGRGS